MAGGQGGSSNHGSTVGGAGGTGYDGNAGSPGQGFGGGGIQGNGGTGGGGGASGGGMGGAGGSSGGASSTTPGYAGGKGGSAGHLDGYAGSGNYNYAFGSTNNGAGGGGGGGGYEAFKGDTLTNIFAKLTGGTGGAGGGQAVAGGGGGGGAGGYGAVVTGTAQSFNSNGLYGGTGGAGGNASQGGAVGGPGAAGGDGGAGAGFAAASANFRNLGTIKGGTGGAGGGSDIPNLATYGGGGPGGAGGAGVVFAKTGFTLANFGGITGGTGGKGGGQGSARSYSPAANGTGGVGGTGVYGSQGGTINNSGMIAGGTGGQGGTGVQALGTRRTYGGNGGRGGDGIGGAGLTIVNTGSISAGAGGAKGSVGTAGAAGNAIALSGGSNTLTLGNTTTTGTITGGIAVGGTLSIDPGTAAGTNVTLANTVHDYSGTVAGSLAKVGAGTLTLSGANTYTHGTTIFAGTLDLASARVVNATTGAFVSAAAGSGDITFQGGPNATATLALEGVAQPGNNGTFANTLDAFTNGNQLDLKGLAYTGGSSPTMLSVVNNTLTVTEGGTSETFKLGGPKLSTYYAQSDGNGGTLITGSPLCFGSTTAIRVLRDGLEADVAVEQLVVGDLAVTASGAVRRIRWLGHRAVDCRRDPAARPVRVAAHAFGPHLPRRDLHLSPGHPVLVGADADAEGGHLVPIMCLINGTTIARTAVDAVSYWHVELDAHDVLLAENLPAESYIDLGSRRWFAGADGLLTNPDLVLAGQPGRCRPVAIDGPVVETERRRLDTVFATRLVDACAWPGDEEARRP